MRWDCAGGSAFKRDHYASASTKVPHRFVEIRGRGSLGRMAWFNAYVVAGAEASANDDYHDACRTIGYACMGTALLGS